MRRLSCILLLLLGVTLHAEDYAARITPLIDPAKLATLGRRGANPRIHKCVYWLDAARKAGQSPEKIADEAGMLTKAGLHASKAPPLRPPGYGSYVFRRLSPSTTAREFEIPRHQM